MKNAKPVTDIEINLKGEAVRVAESEYKNVLYTKLNKMYKNANNELAYATGGLSMNSEHRVELIKALLAICDEDELDEIAEYLEEAGVSHSEPDPYSVDDEEDDTVDIEVIDGSTL